MLGYRWRFVGDTQRSVDRTAFPWPCGRRR